MKSIKFFATVAFAATAIIALSSFVCKDMATCNHETSSEAPTHVHAEGKRCNGTVGCSCPGFSPITNGKVWQQSYCKHCNHHKNSHK